MCVMWLGRTDYKEILRSDTPKMDWTTCLWVLSQDGIAMKRSERLCFFLARSLAGFCRGNSSSQNTQG